MKRILCIILSSILLISNAFLPALAETITDSSFVLPNELEYANDRLIVVLNTETSMLLKNYTAEDFSNIGCKKVDDLSISIVNKIQDQLAIINDQTSLNNNIEKSHISEIKEYNQILCLYLSEAGNSNLIKAANKLLKTNGVVSVSLDYKLTSYNTPNEISDQSLSNWHEIIDIENAWNIEEGSHSVIVGVIDSGFQCTHPDLIGNTSTTLCRDFSSGNIDTCTHQFNNHHGTQVAGVMGAKGRFSDSISGVCKNVTLVSLNIEGDTGSWSTSAIKAIEYAESENFDILNMSMGWDIPYDTNNHYSPALENAIESFSGLFVTAAGNKLKYLPVYETYPANYDLPNLITVGASNTNDTNWVENAFDGDGDRIGSGCGPAVDIFAPGKNILSTSYYTGVGDYYMSDSGTSLSAPMVTGVAALILSKNPYLTPEEVKNIILKHGYDSITISISDTTYSGKRLNARKALESVQTHCTNNSYSSSYCYSYYCSDCDYTYSKPHDLYIYSAQPEDYIIKCRDCNYTVECWESPEYYGADITGHHVDCPDGCYSFFEEHFLSYTQLDILSHTVSCFICGYSDSFNHTFVAYGTQYQCTVCGMISAFIPVMGQTPPDETVTE